jgi:hypothetical protein
VCRHATLLLYHILRRNARGKCKKFKKFLIASSQAAARLFGIAENSFQNRAFYA